MNEERRENRKKKRKDPQIQLKYKRIRNERIKYSKETSLYYNPQVSSVS